MLVSGEAPCCSSSPRGVPCQPSSSPCCSRPRQHCRIRTVATDSAVGTYCHCPPPPEVAAEVLTAPSLSNPPFPNPPAPQPPAVHSTGSQCPALGMCFAGPAGCPSEGGGSADHKNTSRGSVVLHVPSHQPLYVPMEEQPRGTGKPQSLTEMWCPGADQPLLVPCEQI